MTDPDRTLVESSRTHRDRLAAALAHGNDRGAVGGGAGDDGAGVRATGPRRPVPSGLGRAVGSVVLAAVLGVGCLGYSFVAEQLRSTKEDKALAAYRAALAGSPLQPTPGVTQDPTTGYLVDETTGAQVDPQTGFPVDPATGLARDPDGRLVDPRTDWYVDPRTGYATDPATGITVDPDTLTVVEPTPDDPAPDEETP